MYLDLSNFTVLLEACFLHPETYEDKKWCLWLMRIQTMQWSSPILSLVRALLVEIGDMEMKQSIETPIVYQC
jgi:hypothetical protein